MSPRWFRPGRIVRRAVRNNLIRQTRRFYRRRTRRWLIGGAILLAIAGTHRAIKMREEDAYRLEQHYGRPVDQLSEEEIATGMRQLGIRSIELDDNDRKTVYDDDVKESGLKISGQRYCTNCGAILLENAQFCSECGTHI
ncbi:MAG: zinc ribbon domain-containing protein [Asgard group archaeon]|nr:zinc ribbon domain-containing protein [Asgard group archaeon]